MYHLALVAAGGAVGASLRHLVNLAALRLFGPGYPWGTLAVNVVGSLAMGLFVALLALKFQGNASLRLLVATGIFGGFTTFSAFSLDVAVMVERGDIAAAALYVAASVLLSIGALFIGLWVVRAALA
ncbi:MAG TPA: fluoride efflux transporter CrcB [Kaistiaceae bacterium]|nr:fluoride efflux transporter CrcB [Kaistiaceae bacterium]